jgi:nucleotide-binding universal stress UspA family protein
MYKHILVPTDGSDLSALAVKGAVGLAKALGAKITGLHVMPEFTVPSYGEFPVYGDWSEEEFIKETKQEADKLLDAVKAEAQRAGVAGEVVAVRAGQPFHSIVDVAQERGCDLIFMASHGRRGLSALLLGSEAQKVLTHSKIPVLVHRSDTSEHK